MVGVSEVGVFVAVPDVVGVFVGVLVDVELPLGAQPT